MITTDQNMQYQQKEDAELYKQFVDNEGFKRWMTDRVFELACRRAPAGEPWRREGFPTS